MQSNYLPDVASTVAACAAIFKHDAPTVAANGTVAETAIALIGGAPNAIAIGQISICPTAAMTATDASNYATISVYKRTAGGSQTLIGQVTTKPTANGGSGSWVAFTPFAMTLQTGAGSFVTPGDAITYAVTQTGSGSATATGAFLISASVTFD